MHFGFALELSDIDLRNIILLDPHLNWLDTDIPSKYFVYLLNILKTFRQDFFKACLQDFFKMSSECLARCFQDVFNPTMIRGGGGEVVVYIPRTKNVEALRLNDFS